MRTVSPRISLSAVCLAASVALTADPADAQSEPSAQEASIASAQRKAISRARDSEPFYMSAEPLEVKLTTNLRRIRGDKEDKAPWRPATLTYTDPSGKAIEIPTQIRTRGLWRLRNCDFPPLRMNFTREATEGTLFAGVDKPKLVNYCENRDSHEEMIAQELQLYRILNLLTPASHRARLLRIAYTDSASGKTQATRMAIVVEEPEVMAARLGGSVVETKGATPEYLVAHQDVIAAVFQYLIGNTDWSVAGLHNVDLVRQADGNHLPIPYDFDFSGVIDAPYATVDPKLSIQRVRQRLFRGYCYPPEEFAKVFSLFNEKKAAIYGLYSDPIGSRISRRTVTATLKYFDDFYETINDPRRAKSQIIDACLKL